MSVTAGNVTAAKPKVSGAVSYCVAANATLPNNAYANLTNFTNLGYLTTDGISKSESPETDVTKAWGGDTVLVNNNGVTVTFNFKLMEYMNTAVQSLLHGSDNVSGTLESGMAISAIHDDATEYAFVIDEIFKNGVLHRFVIPTAVISEVADTNYKSDEAIVSDITVTCIEDSNGASYYEYMYSGEANDASE